jgi:hypothetical protein
MGMAYTESDYADSVLDMAQRGEPCATESVSSAACLPERALLRAVLQEAILDVRGHATGIAHKNRRRVAQQAYYWMLSRDVTWTFSFENICALLGFDADCLRRWVLRDAPVVPAAESDAAHQVRGGGMLRAVRAARMRGNQQKKPLRLRRRGTPPRTRMQTPVPLWSESCQ